MLELKQQILNPIISEPQKLLKNNEEIDLDIDLISNNIQNEEYKTNIVLKNEENQEKKDDKFSINIKELPFL